ncbi:MAG: phage tail protein [Proteobacteria bacterium]|nr:phage tail protein [Pseudomonadota bacterium]
MESFIGAITLCGFNFAPRGYATCNGQILPIQQNTALFSLIGTYYGGNGMQNFALPNLAGQTVIMPDGNQVPYIGEIGGTEARTLLLPNLPPHTHTIAASSNTGASGPVAHYPGGSGSYDAAAANTTMAPLALAPAGQNLPISLMKPYTVMNFVIALYGIFPPRS